MHPLSWAAIAVALIAVAGLIELPNSWFFGLLSLASLLAAGDAAYREVTDWAVALLTVGALCAVAALCFAFRTGRRSGT